MPCYEHHGNGVWIETDEEVFLDREPEIQDDADLVRAFAWRRCDHPQDHQTPATNDAVLRFRARLLEKKFFKPVGICREREDERQALYHWPANAGAIKVVGPHSEEACPIS